MRHPTFYLARRRPIAGARYSMYGFTLIELMVVVVILITMLGVVTPSFRAFIETQQVKSLSYDLTADLLLARSEALKRNANVSVARTGGGGEGGWATTAVVANEIIARRNSSAQAVTVTSAPATIVFDANGRVLAPAAAVRITISNSNGSAHRCIELDLSGRARSRYGACA